MFPSRCANRTSRVLLAALLLNFLLIACCTHQPTVHMGAPHDRYDHNRTVIVNEWAYHKWNGGDEPQEMILELDRLTMDDVYRPYGHQSAPRSAMEADGLPAANLIPIYTGVLLPLSAEVKDGERSDRDDLIDFLGTGPVAHKGVEPPDTMGALPEETAATYKAMLDLLAAADTLSSRDAVQKWAKEKGVEWTFSIIDARYLETSFTDRIALGFGDFWFVLYSPVDRVPYTRLVVVPKKLGEELEKKPVKGGE